VWRKLKRHGALPLRSSGYVLPNNATNQERFEWLAAAIRKYKGEASVVQVHAIDDLPSEALVQRFVEARSRDYETLIRELQKVRPTSAGLSSHVARLRNRFQEIAGIDFFTSPLRGRVETLLDRMDSLNRLPAEKNPPGRTKKEYLDRSWLTRPRPGIDRVSSAWLIRKFIDPKAKFLFATDPRLHSQAVPFDMFQQAGGFWPPRRGLHVRNPAKGISYPRPARDDHRADYSRRRLVRRQVWPRGRVGPGSCADWVGSAGHLRRRTASARHGTDQRSL
jgi:hypothetical protein